MTDRHAGYVVVLSHDVREDDAEDIISAITMVKGVESVEPVTSTPDTHIAMARADAVWRERLIELLKRPS